MRNEITQAYLKEALSYNPDTGEFTWRERPESHFIENCKFFKSWNTKFAGTIAGSVSVKGYSVIGIENKSHPSHRLAWIYTYGSEPSEIDHINHVKTDNRISNLREVTHHENTKNITMRSDNTSGFTGVSWFKRDKVWTVHININGKSKNMGYHQNLSDAVLARVNAEIKYGYHNNHGK